MYRIRTSWSEKNVFHPNQVGEIILYVTISLQDSLKFIYKLDFTLSKRLVYWVQGRIDTWQKTLQTQHMKLVHESFGMHIYIYSWIINVIAMAGSASTF